MNPILTMGRCWYLAGEARGSRGNVVHHRATDAAVEAEAEAERHSTSEASTVMGKLREDTHQRETGRLLLSSTVRKRDSNSVSILAICKRPTR